MSTLDFTPELGSTLGSLFIGGILTTALWGASVVQLYFYFDRHSGSDGWWIQTSVILIWALDTVHQAIFVHLLYTSLITNFTNLLLIAHFDEEGASLIIVTAFINLFVQLIFMMRIWHLSKRNYLLTGISAIFIIAHFASTAVYFAVSYHFSSLTQFSTVFNVERVMNSIGFLTDTTIAGILAYLLTGFLMDLCSLTALITSALLPDTFVFLTVLIIYPKLYTNSVFALLNTRHRRRRNISYGTDGMMFRESVWLQSANNHTHSRNDSNLEFTAIEIKVDAETVVRRETSETTASNRASASHD
ncbi:uncharacterized protein FOMMEDRAFT_161678 [Fomitiporia mediterranea MF3/22]|uniref:uncharacterized protein n=1 Tax=Fomitiporia mediterranea (strain MF3/22) TaxID=694068 RepID=UPI0004409665|nr:uncharacterized protein FOMMEDRAFT_161678 [Fomitiporia mediterranea MF3/22]EJC98334.1 hypothetical protein FOMMEDRAFT_161678 [Fomitiporia mediterranea MF3/22]